MELLPISFLLSLGFLFCSCTYYRYEIPPRFRDENAKSQSLDQYKYFTAEFNWGATYCKRFKCKQDPKGFTLSKLVPKQVQYRGPPKDITKIEKLLKDWQANLEAYWPVLSAKDFAESRAYWISELQDNGPGCNAKFSLNAYVSQAINLAREHTVRIYQALHDKNIFPGKEPLAPTQIREAVEGRYQRILKIIYVEIEGEYYLAEVHLCLDYHAQTVIDCPDEDYSPHVENVYYPPPCK